MKPLTIIGMLLFAMLPTAPAEDDPFAESDGEAVRPERRILKLPGGVTHKVIEGTRHQYTVSDIYMGAASEEKDPEDASATYSFLIPDVLDLDLDFKAKKATFTTSRKLTLSELAYAIDDMAKLGGDIPFWAELEARDLETTKDFARISCTVEPTEQEIPPDLAGFWVPKDKVFQIPLSFGGPDLGSLLVVPTTAFCMCHSRFSLRVLDPEGKLIWKEEGTAYAGVKIALSNANEFGMHKIWLTRDDHGVSKRFLISGHFLQEQEIEQGGTGHPATRPESKSEGSDKPQPESERRSR
jgi:hypothetical protein